jgi:hypothetical protein
MLLQQISKRRADDGRNSQTPQSLMGGLPATPPGWTGPQTADTTRTELDGSPGFFSLFFRFIQWSMNASFEELVAVKGILAKTAKRIVELSRAMCGYFNSG